MSELAINRRRLLVAGAVAGAAKTAQSAARHDGMLGEPPADYRGAVSWQEGAADAPPVVDPHGGYRFFKVAEAQFVEAAVERLIPSDSTGPGALEAGVPIFIDRQLAGPYGRGDHFFLGGPWPKGTPEQGYQSRFSPAQLYRAAIVAIGNHLSQRHNGANFHQLSINDQDAFLKGLETGEIVLEGIDGAAFFTLLLQNAKEGYWSDPIYGGNRDMAAWKMIGFPGARYDYLEWVPRHGQPVPYPVVGLLGRRGWSQG